MLNMESKLRIAAPITLDSIVDGEGLRAVIWTQGCPHGCEGCHNPQTHDVTQGDEVQVAALLKVIQEDPLLDGITLSGGEPFLQPEPLVVLAKACKAMGLTIWAYTGYSFETLLQNSKQRNLLEVLDVLVDGPYIQTLRSHTLYFRGSANQRVIDVQASLASNHIVLYHE